MRGLDRVGEGVGEVVCAVKADVCQLAKLCALTRADGALEVGVEAVDMVEADRVGVAEGGFSEALERAAVRVLSLEGRSGCLVDVGEVGVPYGL